MDSCYRCDSKKQFAFAEIATINTNSSLFLSLSNHVTKVHKLRNHSNTSTCFGLSAIFGNTTQYNKQATQDHYVTNSTKSKYTFYTLSNLLYLFLLLSARNVPVLSILLRYTVSLRMADRPEHVAVLFK